MSHLVVISLPSGVIRVLCASSSPSCKAERLPCYFFVAELLLAKVKAEISRQYIEGEEESLKDIRIISILDSNRDNADLPKVIAAYTTVYDAPYKALIAGESLTCTTGQFLAPAQLHSTRLLTGDRVPIFAWVTGSAPVIIRYYCPENVGGLGDVAGRAKTNFEAAGEGAVLERFIEAVSIHFVFPVATISLPFSEPLFNTMEGKLFQTLNDSDGTIINTSEAYEAVFIETLRSWLGGMGKAFFSIGPPSHAEQTDVELFLENALDKYGKESVIFEILNVMIEKDFPLYALHHFAYGSPAAKLPENLKSSSKGLLAKWVPQQYILNHPGSTTEALSSGVPMICYPFTSDQPFNAAYLTLTLDAPSDEAPSAHGRTDGAEGHGEAVRAEILAVVHDARGAVGQRKRANARRIQGILGRHVKRFVDLYCA
ncbi:hypothetical protein BJ912DRAFT_987553 [Pholiota molesta]|nr:hypothetical protein BJ912DRAFT_987553 [Pholiota molesta]